MSTTSISANELLREGGANVPDLAADVDLVAVLRAANAEGPAQSWKFFADIHDRQAPRLTVGLAGDVGFVRWWDGHRTVWPAITHPTGTYVDYTQGDHHHQVDAGHQVPAEYVFAAVAEFVATGHRPHCVPWVLTAA